MKEKLKKNVVRIVRDHFPQAPAASNGAGGASGQDAFYSELYVYLMEQVHTAVNDAFKKADDGEAPPAVPKPDDSGARLEEEVSAREWALQSHGGAGMHGGQVNMPGTTTPRRTRHVPRRQSLPQPAPKHGLCVGARHAMFNNGTRVG